MELTCDRCGRSSYVPDDLVQGRAFRARCPDCEGVLEIPADRANALDDQDLAWLSSDGKAPEAPPSEPLFEKAEVTEKKLAAFEQKATAQRRRSGLALAAGTVVAVAAAAAAVLFVLGRMGGGGPFAPRAREEAPAQRAEIDREIQRLQAALDALNAGGTPRPPAPKTPRPPSKTPRP